MWQTILIEVGKGVLAGIGTKLFSSLFGSGSAPDYVSAILRAIEHMAVDLKRNLKLELERIEVQEARTALLAAQRKARQYNLSPDTRDDVLDEITVDLTDVITNLEVLGPVALPAYMVAASLEVAVIQERGKRRGEHELAIAVCDSIPSATLHYKQMLDELKAWNESRFTAIRSRVFYDRRGEIGYIEYSYAFDGKAYTDGDSGGDLDGQGRARLAAKRELHIQRVWDEIRLGLEPVAENLRQIRQWAKESGVQCATVTCGTVKDLALSAYDETSALEIRKTSEIPA